MATGGFYMGTYDPQQVVLTVDDIPVIGFQDGDGIVVERSGDFSSETVGMKGEVSRSISRDVTGTLKVTLQHNSPSVVQFEDMMHEDFPPVVRLAVFDPASAESFGTSYGWMKTDASHSYGTEVGSREYTFFMTNIRKGSFLANFAKNLGFGLANNAV